MKRSVPKIVVLKWMTFDINKKATLRVAFYGLTS